MGSNFEPMIHPSHVLHNCDSPINYPAPEHIINAPDGLIEDFLAAVAESRTGLNSAS